MLVLPAILALPGGAGSVGGAFAQGGPGRPASQIGGPLGVRVDTTWQLTPQGLGALIDQVGGITVDVAKPVPLPGGTLGPARNR